MAIRRPPFRLSARAAVRGDGDVRDGRTIRPQSGEVSWRDADDAVPNRPDLNCRVERGGSCTIARAPERVAHDGHPCAVRRDVLGIAEVATEQWRRIEETKKACAHDANGQLLRVVTD